MGRINEWMGTMSRSSRSAWIEILSVVSRPSCSAGRAPRGARGLKYNELFPQHSLVGRAPRGARGLKFRINVAPLTYWKGRAPRGARGLKCMAGQDGVSQHRRAPRGARGLKCIPKAYDCIVYRRAPRGARGLKFENCAS